ncbi:DNA-binding response regulator [Cytophagales bacterium WSM2-2]|nr:DNA-binding response regulator [Cytophagales bacterium WSM2-2]
MSQVIKVAIADDHQVFRRSLLVLLGREESIKVIAEATDGEELLQQLQTEIPDIILMDIRMPRLDGFETTKVIRDKYPNIKIIAFTTYEFETYVVEMNKLGVKSFLCKEKCEDLARVIKIVHEGGVYFPDDVAEVLQRHLSDAVSATRSSAINLSEMEKTLLHAICKGWSSTQIASVLHKSPRTIEEYRENLYAKFEVDCKEELIVHAVKFNLVNT